MLLTVTQTIFC